MHCVVYYPLSLSLHCLFLIINSNPSIITTTDHHGEFGMKEDLSHLRIIVSVEICSQMAAFKIKN